VPQTDVKLTPNMISVVEGIRTAQRVEIVTGIVFDLVSQGSAISSDDARLVTELILDRITRTGASGQLRELSAAFRALASRLKADHAKEVADKIVDLVKAATLNTEQTDVAVATFQNLAVRLGDSNVQLLAETISDIFLKAP